MLSRVWYGTAVYRLLCGMCVPAYNVHACAPSIVFVFFICKTFMAVQRLHLRFTASHRRMKSRVERLFWFQFHCHYPMTLWIILYVFGVRCAVIFNGIEPSVREKERYIHYTRHISNSYDIETAKMKKWEAHERIDIYLLHSNWFTIISGRSNCEEHKKCLVYWFRRLLSPSLAVSLRPSFCAHHYLHDIAIIEQVEKWYCRWKKNYWNCEFQSVLLVRRSQSMLTLWTLLTQYWQLC